jgi:alkanesulfonate monooxygenase
MARGDANDTRGDVNDTRGGSMSVEFTWCLPPHGDGTRRTPDGHPRAPLSPADDIERIVTLVRVIEYAGFHGVLLQDGNRHDDAWLLAAALARDTRTLRFIVTVQPGNTQPALVAQATQTLQSLTQNRVQLNLVTGVARSAGYPDGGRLEHNVRIARADEFLGVLEAMWRGRAAWFGTPGGGFRHDGEFYQLEGAGLAKPLRVVPPIWLGGDIEQEEQLATRRADVYLLRHEPRVPTRIRIARLQEAAASHGRTLRFGCQLHLISRETAREAQWLAAHTSRARGGAMLTGSVAEIADQIDALHGLGIENFILSGSPDIEEVLRFSEEISPLVRRQPASGKRADQALV